jgi:hypothetical protein
MAVKQALHSNKQAETGRRLACEPHPALNRASMSLRCKNYRLENVYLKATAEQRARLSAFWLRERAIADPWEAERRAHEAAFLVYRDDTRELAGVSSVGLKRLEEGRTYYDYRMFLRERDRVPYLMWTVTDASRDFLREFKHPKTESKGMLIAAENPKLMRPGMRRSFQRHGYRYLGQNRKGQDLWLAEFAKET